MITRIKKYSSLLIMMLTFALGNTLTGCYEDVPDKYLPTIPPKLVVHSFISPGDTLRVYVAESFPIEYNYTIDYDHWDDYEIPILKDAEVYIRNTTWDHYVKIPYSEAQNSFFFLASEFTVEHGKEYELWVKYPGLPEVFARTTVPTYTPELLSFSVDTLGDDTNWFVYVFSGTIQDPSGENNYYRSHFSLSECFYYEGMDEWYCYTNMYNEFFSDQDNDGGVISFKHIYQGSQWNRYEDHILSCDIHYYEFHKSLSNYNESNIFMEPSPVYTNVQNGYGIFASYTQTVVKYN